MCVVQEIPDRSCFVSECIYSLDISCRPGTMFIIFVLCLFNPSWTKKDCIFLMSGAELLFQEIDYEQSPSQLLCLFVACLLLCACIFVCVCVMCCMFIY